MAAPRVTDHKANRWLKRRGTQLPRALLFSVLTADSCSFVFHLLRHTDPQERNQQQQQQQAHPQQTTKSGDLSTSDPHIFLGTFACWGLYIKEP
jgi:hypothetical protein